MHFSMISGSLKKSRRKDLKIPKSKENEKQLIRTCRIQKIQF
jgi:hypothetical protein